MGLDGQAQHHLRFAPNISEFPMGFGRMRFRHRFERDRQGSFWNFWLDVIRVIGAYHHDVLAFGCLKHIRILQVWQETRIFYPLLVIPNVGTLVNSLEVALQTGASSFAGVPQPGCIPGPDSEESCWVSLPKSGTRAELLWTCMRCIVAVCLSSSFIRSCTPHS